MFLPGVLYSCFEILDIARSNEIKLDDFNERSKNLNLFKVNDALELGITLGFIEKTKNGKLKLTNQGYAVLRHKKYKEFTYTAILKYAEKHKPLWLKYASFGREKVLQFCSDELKQIFIEGELDCGNTAEIVIFWDTLAEMARESKKSDNLSIGRLGERLSFIYETERTKEEPIWMALEDNMAGYDILSKKNTDDEIKIKIEVKTSKNKEGLFFLTKNEWEEAETSKYYYFHLWNINQVSSPQIGIIGKEEVAIHIPKKQNLGEWNQVEIPFAAFSKEMKPVTLKKILDTLNC